jgi:transmembrane sensor
MSGGAFNETLILEAATWQSQLSELGAESTPEFEAWLEQPGAEEAWARVRAPWEYLGEHANDPDVIAQRQVALGHARKANSQRQAPHDWRRIVGSAAAILLLAFVIGGGYAWLTSPADYETGLGERRVITLVDGSRVSLDSNSEVTVKYSRNARELHLLRGQARFDVAHNVERPFSVLAGDQKVIATGTAFNVDLSGPKVLVTLIEGHVVVVDEANSTPLPMPTTLQQPERHIVELKAGQQLAALPAVPPEIVPANLQHVTAWTSGQLMFDNERLSDVVARINRYTDKPISIDDPIVGAMRISGVFNTGDVAGFVVIVTQYLPVRAVSDDAGNVALKSTK